MKVLNGTEYPFDAGGNLAPWQFYGSGAPSTERQFLDAPEMSFYWDVTNHIVYYKAANARTAADWKQLVTTAGAQTVAGNLTVTGTVTAGDLVATAG